MFLKKVLVLIFGIFSVHPTSSLQMSLQGTKILLDGVFLNKGTPAEGLLLNSRMIQGISDGYTNYKYPDTNIWNATRNNEEFIENMCLWKQKGLNGFTIGLQGGAPKVPLPSGISNSLFRSDGTLKQAYLNRLQLILEQSKNLQMIPIVSFFYRGQVKMFGNYNNALIGYTNMLKWLKSFNYHQFIIIEPVNECEFSEFSAVGLSCSQHIVDLLNLAKSYGFFAGNSLKGGVKPPDSIIGASSIILVHGNGISSNSGYKSLVDSIKKSSKYKGQPIIFNEAGETTSYLDYCVSIGVSWGYYSQGNNNYIDGYQSPPVNWGINTKKKIDFFNKVSKYIPN